MKRVRATWKWNWRRGGGIVLGLCLQFPVNVIYEEDPHASWQTWSLSLGLIAAELHIDMLTKRNLPPTLEELWEAEDKFGTAAK